MSKPTGNEDLDMILQMIGYDPNTNLREVLTGVKKFLLETPEVGINYVVFKNGDGSHPFYLPLSDALNLEYNHPEDELNEEEAYSEELLEALRTLDIDHYFILAEGLSDPITVESSKLGWEEFEDFHYFDQEQLSVLEAIYKDYGLERTLEIVKRRRYNISSKEDIARMWMDDMPSKYEDYFDFDKYFEDEIEPDGHYYRMNDWKDSIIEVEEEY